MEEIFVNVSIEVLDKEEKFIKGSPFDRNRISSNRDLIKKISGFSWSDFSRINSLFSAEELGKHAEEYIDDWIKKVVSIVRKDGLQYEPSEGEKSILSITGIIENTSYDCYIFDEIERGLGHKYISDYLIPKLMFLRDLGKMVIVSTHNANIAISTLPSQSVFCNYQGDDSEHIYYSGNMYSNELISIDDIDSLVWEKEALKHLEGSGEMFGVRRNIWKLKD